MTQNNPYDDPNFVGPVNQSQGPSAGQQAAIAAATAVPGILARIYGGGGNSNVPPQLLQLLQQQVDRNQYQNPLYQAVTNQAFQGLPTYARDGLSLGSLGNGSVSQMSGGSGNFFTSPGGSAVTSLLAPWAVQAIRALLHGTSAGSGAGAAASGGSAASGSGSPFGGALPTGAPSGGQGYGGMFPNTDPFWGDPRGGTGTATLPGVPVGTGAGPGEDPRHD